MGVSPEEFRGLLDARQTIRFFEDGKAIPIETLEAIIDDAQQAPNDCNHQSWKFIVVTDPELKQKLVDTAGSCEPARRAPVLVVPLIESGWNHNKFSIIQTLAGATNTLILSAKTRGIASVWMAGIGNVDSIRKLLNIPPAYIIDCFVGLGYAEEPRLPWPKAPRQQVKNIYSLNGFKFSPDRTYPLKPAKKYDFFKISNQHNPYALWNPKDWTLGQIAFFRGNAVWAGSPSSTLHKSRRLAKEFEKEIELTLPHLKEGKTLVMLPYSGAYSAALLKRNPEIKLTHFELSPNHESIIKKRMKEEGIEKEIPFTCDENLTVPFPDGSFDNVLVFQALESVPNPGVLVKEATRLLSQNGRIVITGRNKWSWLFVNFLRTTRKETVWNFGPYWPISPRELKGLVQNTFKGTWYGVSPVPNRIGKLMVSWPWKYLCRLTVFTGEKM